MNSRQRRIKRRYRARLCAKIEALFAEVYEDVDLGVRLGEFQMRPIEYRTITIRGTFDA